MGGLLLCAECGALLLLMEVTGKATPLDFSLVITCLAMWSLPSFIATCKCWKLSCPHTQSPLSQPQMCSSFYHSNWLANLTPFTSTRWSMSLPSFLQLFLSIQTKILGKFPFLLSPALFSILRQVCSLLCWTISHKVSFIISCQGFSWTQNSWEKVYRLNSPPLP